MLPLIFFRHNSYMTVSTSVAPAHDAGLIPPKKRRVCFNKPSCSIDAIDDVRDELESLKKTDDICDLLEDLIKQHKLDPNQIITLADKRTMTLEQLLELAKKRRDNDTATSALKSGMSLELMKLKREAIDHVLKEMDRFDRDSAGYSDPEKKEFVSALLRYSKEHNLCSKDSINEASKLLAQGKYDDALDLMRGQVKDLQQRLGANMNRAQASLLAMRLGKSTHVTFNGGVPVPGSPPPSYRSLVPDAPKSSDTQQNVVASLAIDEPKRQELSKLLQAVLEALDEKKLQAQKNEQEQLEESRQEALQEIRIVEKICHELGVPESYIQVQFAHLESLPIDSLRALILNVKKQFELDSAAKA